jgi:predicted phosphodiesterase
MADFHILVLSDLHLHQGDTEGGSPSYLSSRPSLASPTRNPLTGVPELLALERIRPNWVLCPGDLGDKCDEVAQSKAWADIQVIKRKTRAQRVFGTVGNHDVDSRRGNPNRRPNDSLFGLNPNFPISRRRLSDEYWRRNFVFISEQQADINLLIVNSCAFHGVVAPEDALEEFKHGRISVETIERISDAAASRLRSRNILLLHHHIKQHPWLPGENSHMENGPALLEALRATGRQWLVIHGHQHLPNLSYAEGGTLSPIVFSAGSISALTTEVRGRRPRNQLYCIKFDLDAPSNNGLRGQVMTWDWFPYTGWQKASRDSGLPHSCGFGFRGALGTLAESIVAEVQASPRSRLLWQQLFANSPDLKFLIPEDMEALLAELERHGATIDYDRWGSPRAVGL